MNKDDFKHGDKVTCCIKNIEIKDGKISINRDGDMFICQDLKKGSFIKDMFGYKYSWNIYKSDQKKSFESQLKEECIDVTKLEKKITETLKIGDSVKYGLHKGIILGYTSSKKDMCQIEFENFSGHSGNSILYDDYGLPFNIKEDPKHKRYNVEIIYLRKDEDTIEISDDLSTKKIDKISMDLEKQGITRI